MRKKILIIASIYRVGERIYPLIHEFHKFADLDLLQINEMSNDMISYGNIDYRELFHIEYDKFFDNKYDGTISSIESKGARDSNPSQTILDLDVTKYDMIFYDDNRTRHGLWNLYQRKRTDCIMIANTHCNSSLNPQPNDNPPEGHNNGNYIVDNYQKVFDYCFVHGNIERNAYDNKDYIITGGIPSNDELKYYDRTNDFILVIVNFLGNAYCPYNISFDGALFNNMNLLELQRLYNKKIVFKIKSRANHSSVMADSNYVTSFMPAGLDFDIVTDFENNNQLVCGAALVIGSTSTLSFKPIQKGIPTVLTNKTGCIGSYYSYRSLVDVDSNFIERVENEMNAGRDIEFIGDALEGGLEFNSTEVYTNKVRELMSV